MIALWKLYVSTDDVVMGKIGTKQEDSENLPEEPFLRNSKKCLKNQKNEFLEREMDS